MATKQNLVSIDGTYYDIMIPENGIQRSFSIVDSDNSGRLADGSMVRDIIGTYYNYTVQFETKYMSVAEYDKLIEVLSSPVDYHTITVPYGQTTMTFQAYCTTGSDKLAHVVGGKNKWDSLSINFIAMSPQRRGA